MRRTTLIGAFASALIAGVGTAPSVAAGAAPSQAVPQTPCVQQAAATVSDGSDWACVGDTLTVIAPGGEQKVQTVAAKGDSPQSSIQASTSESTENIIAYINGVQYVVPFTHDIEITASNQAFASQRYTASPGPVGITYSLRIQNDQFGFDDTIWEYGGRYGSSTPVTSFSDTRFTGDGPTLPINGIEIFWNAYDINFRADGTEIGIAGSVQSNRATCDTGGCQF